LKTKTKTPPGLADTDQIESQVDAPASPTPSSEDLPQVPVTKESLKVLPKAFRSGKDNGQIYWTSWVKALVDLGFGAQNIGGLAARFVNETRSIDFRKPHPDLKVGWHKIDAMAKRLTTHFGWMEESLVLREKVTNE
jgi:hypothetical protein